MARKRTIDPDLWTDDRVQGLPSPAAVLLYIGLISHADDEGRIEWNARQFLARIFAFRPEVDLPDIEAGMEAIAESGLVRVYEAKGRTYAVHPAWQKHQYVNRPQLSKIPPPPPVVDEDEADADAIPAASWKGRKARIPDIVKRDVAIRYGCAPGDEKAVQCACGAPGLIVWHTRRDGRPSSWVSLVDLEWDHIVQEAHGGETTADNIQLSCRPCNRGRNTPASRARPAVAPRGAEGGAPLQPASDPRGASGAPRGPSVSVSVSGLAPNGAAPPASRTPRQQQLPNGDEQAAREILASLWPRVEATVKRAMTRTEWGKRNKRAALDMARVGLSIPEIVAAHEQLCRDRGETIYTLSWVQDAIARGGVGKSRFPDEPNASDNLPTLADLVDAGLVESWTP